MDVEQHSPEQNDPLALHFYQEVGPQDLGIFWFTNHSLTSFPEPFFDIDYLLDGLLSDHIEKVEKNEIAGQFPKHFFMSNNFGRPFFVAHLVKSPATLKDDIKNLMQLFSQSKNALKDQQDQDQSIKRDRILLVFSEAFSKNSNVHVIPFTKIEGEEVLKKKQEINFLQKNYPQFEFIVYEIAAM